MLSEYKEQAIRAHYNTSFSPEKIGTAIVESYSEMLKEDLAFLGENAGNYKEKFKRYFSDWISAKSKCMSSFITGPSNFPVRKAQKANNSEHNKYEAFMAWRKKYIKRAMRVPTPSPEEDLQSALEDLDKLIIAHETMKRINQLSRKYKKSDAVIDHVKKEELLSGEALQHLIETASEWEGKKVFPSYSLTNSNATIKSRREKVLIMKSRIETKSNWTAIEFDGGIIDIENDRVIIRHDQKPSRDVINKIKSYGFCWSRNFNCWCRKHTQQAIKDAKSIVGI